MDRTTEIQLNFLNLSGFDGVILFRQESKAIIQLIYIPKDYTQIIPFIDYNKWLKRLDTQLNETTNQSPKRCITNK